MSIKIDKNVAKEKLNQIGVFNWPIWEKGVSEFPWTYDQEEVCYLLEGSVIISASNVEPVQIEKGDFVTFSKGLSCHWKIIDPVRKHYHFSD